MSLKLGNLCGVWIGLLVAGFTGVKASDYDPFHQIERLTHLLQFYEKKGERKDDSLVRKIRLNLERWKGIYMNFSDKFIFVNIPTYTLYAVDRGKIQFSQKVIVGQKSRKTPLFSTHLTRVVLNPGWSLPPSIFIKDKLPKLLKDPAYLSDRGYVVRDQSGQVVNSKQIRWASLSKNHLPYTIHQKPGQGNALGQVKFELHDTSAIIMHGTPLKHLFKKDQRTFSSGCIRVENPLKLAAWALDYTQKEATLGSKVEQKSTASFTPKRSLGVFVSYITLWVDDLNHLVITADPYAMDRKS